MLLSKERINTGRQPEIDMFKAFCVVCMILEHTYECCAAEANPILNALEWICAFTGAAAFMICMGLGMRYSRHQGARDYLARGFELLTVGQLLNLMRNALPNLIAWWATGEQFFIANALLVIQSDILTFAGLAFMLLAGLKVLRVPDAGVLGLGLGLNVLGWQLSNALKSPPNYLLSQLLGFLVRTDAEAYFPLCSYFVFVAFGYWLGGVYPRIADKRRLSERVLAVGLPVCTAWYALRLTVDMPGLPEFNSDLQYILLPGPDAAALCLTAAVILAALYRLSLRMGGRTPVAVDHLSRHINQYYCVSYVLIMPMRTLLMATRGELMPGGLLPTLYGLLVLAACYCIIEWNEKHLRFGIVTLRGKRRIVAHAAIWAATFAVVAYAYPRIEVFANVWNEYLL